jgi:dihydrodipicolinate synthase/N-acetylneuraminate lyase
MRNDLRGVVPVLEVPFRADDSVDEGGFARVIEELVRRDVRTMMFPGFASEFYKLTDDERDRLVALLLDRTAGDPEVSAIISIPDHATATAVRRAASAVERGAAAINVLPPHFLAPSRAEIVDHLAAVLHAVAPTPVVVQIAPAQTGSLFDVADLKGLAARYPNLAMVKVEAQPPGRLIAALAEPPAPLASAVGYAGLAMIDALTRGAVGVWPGCSFVEIYQEIWRRWQSNDVEGAGELHRRLLPFISYWMQNVELMIAAEKLISRERGWISCSRCRGPAWRFDEIERKQIASFLHAFGALLETPVSR